MTLLMVLLLACGAGAPPPSGETAAACAGLEGENRDWCTLAWLHGGEAGTPEAGAAVPICQAMTTPDAVDQCLDLVVRQGAPDPVALCSAIQAPLLRDSCQLEVADALRPSRATFDEMLEDCARTDSIELFCLTHLIPTRANAWSRDTDSALAELDAMLARFPAARDSAAIAATFHVAATRPGTPARLLDDGCPRFDAAVHEACTTAGAQPPGLGPPLTDGPPLPPG